MQYYYVENTLNVYTCYANINCEQVSTVIITYWYIAYYFVFGIMPAYEHCA